MMLGPRAVPAAFFLAIAVLVAGCGGGTNALTLEEYFEQFTAIDADAGAQLDALYADFPEGAAALTDDANLPYFKKVMAAFPHIISELHDRLGDLAPPAEMEDAHNELIAAGEDLLAAFEEGGEVFEEAETMAEFSALNEGDSDLNASVEQFEAACLAFVAIAAANSIPVTITCLGD